MPTAFQNDANAAAFGEYWVGAGKDVHSMVLFTLGTGIGGGIILDDKVLEGEHSHGAELGHMKIDLGKTAGAAAAAGAAWRRTPAPPPSSSGPREAVAEVERPVRSSRTC